MTVQSKEPNPLSQTEIIQNSQLSLELLSKIITNLEIEKGDITSINSLNSCLERIKLDIDDCKTDKKLVKEVLYKEIDKITKESTGNDWDKNHPFNAELTAEQLFDRIQSMQCGRKIKLQRSISQNK